MSDLSERLNKMAVSQSLVNDQWKLREILLEAADEINGLRGLGIKGVLVGMVLGVLLGVCVQ